MKPSIPAFLGSMLLGAALAVPLSAVSEAATSASVNLSRLTVSNAAPTQRIDPALLQATGSVDVIVQLTGVPLARVNGENARREGGLLSRAQQIAHSQQVRKSQDDVLARVIALGGKEIARVRIAYNAAIVRIDASKVPALATIPGVSTVQRVVDYKIDLSETVPYIGAAAAQAVGLDGFGVRVAVLDSGIDYTHRNLGGDGTEAAYEAAYGTSPADARNKTTDGLFPTDKVIGGTDFVGERWDGTPTSPPLEPDPDPIDFGAHGTHVADIIAGKSRDGKHVGVAPGASLYAVKVCSAVSTSCSGVALLEGIDFALDPDGDGSMDDAVDVINMSLGSQYGLREDSTSAAAANAARAGVVVVAAAGNSGDKPYVLGSPSSAPEVISVAQTQVPSAEAIPLVVNSPAAIAGTYGNTATVDWAPIVGTVMGDVAFVGRGCATPTVDPYLADPAGKIALIDRGACNISEKVARATAAGATGIIIGLVAAGDAVSFSNGGQCPLASGAACKPTLVIQQVLANSIKTNIAAPVNATISANNGVMLVGSMASTSARGPSYDFNQIKPDIGAPGASVSAVAGTGTGEEAFGGTSGATPMVSGSAAILIQAYPNRSPWAIKSLLMNTADVTVYTNPATQPGVLAPITRIGGGEVRVDDAIASTTAAWDTQLRTGSLSFGYLNVSDETTLVRKVKVQNYSRSNRRYNLSSSFRFANDASSGAVKLLMPSSIYVPGRGSETFDVVMKIDPTKLPTWTLNGGPNGGIGALLQTVEYDGYVTISDSRDNVHLAWQVLPHKSADVQAVNKTVTIPGNDFGLLALQNFSRAQDGALDVFALTGTSPRIPRRDLPADGSDVTVTDLASVGVRLVEGGVLQFAISTYGRRAHPLYPAGLIVEIDANRDGKPDYDIFNTENGGFDTTGQTLTAIQNLKTGGTSAFFYADADLDSGNMIFTVPLAAVGLTADTQFSFDVFAYDNYFTGNVSDSIEGMVFTPSKPKFVTSDPPADGIPARSGALIAVDDFASGDTASPSQSGLLLMYRDARIESETIAVKVKPKKK
jgi:minor extracellular serine protease Vpr